MSDLVEAKTLVADLGAGGAIEVARGVDIAAGGARAAMGAPIGTDVDAEDASTLSAGAAASLAFSAVFKAVCDSTSLFANCRVSFSTFRSSFRLAM